jgi:hypothetical protein
MGTPALLATANALLLHLSDLVNNPFNVANADLFDANGQLNTAAKLLYANDLDWAKQLQRAGVRKMLISHPRKNGKSNYWCGGI